MNHAAVLRQLLSQDEVLVIPGVYDGLSARLAQQAGFPVIFTTGFGLAAGTLGMPDLGLLTMSESLDRVAKIVRAVDVPVIADMDTGYGNALNVYRTVRECVAQGVAGIFLEDQEWPKKCGHMEDKRVISAEEQAGKLQAAVHARGDDDLVIVSRTDARGPLGLDEAIRRQKLYREAGADVVFVEAPLSVEELAEVAAAFPNVPLVANMIEGGKTPLLSGPELQALGYKIALYPLSGLFSAAKSIRETYKELREKKTTAGRMAEMVSFHEFEEIIGAAGYRELERRFAPLD